MVAEFFVDMMALINVTTKYSANMAVIIVATAIFCTLTALLAPIVTIGDVLYLPRTMADFITDLAACFNLADLPYFCACGAYLPEKITFHITKILSSNYQKKLPSKLMKKLPSELEKILSSELEKNLLAIYNRPDIIHFDQFSDELALLRGHYYLVYFGHKYIPP